jgi:hypothetical protein
VVARVDGRPVYGSCVAAQAAAMHEDRRRALDDCVGFEVLAGAAAARKVAADPEVIEGYRRALVNRFVDVEFRQKYQKPEDLPAKLLDSAFEQFKWRMHRPLFRFAVYVRAPLGKKATPAEDDAAHALVQEIYDRLKDRKDLFAADLFETGAAVAHGRKLEDSPSPYGTGEHGPGDQTFTQPLFAIPEIGMVAPPARTKWGWDLILWVDTMSALETPKEGVLAWLFPQLRQSLFGEWVGEIIKDRHLDIEVDEAKLGSR